MQIHKIKIITTADSSKLEALVQEWFDQNLKITLVNCSYSQNATQSSIAIIYR